MDSNCKTKFPYKIKTYTQTHILFYTFNHLIPNQNHISVFSTENEHIMFRIEILS